VRDKKTRWLIPLGSATLTGVGTVIAYKLTESLDNSQSWAIVGGWTVAGIIVTYLVSRLQARSQEENPEAIKERVGQLQLELRNQVQARSYGARRQLIEAPLRELDLDITPRLGWARDPRLIEPEAPSDKVADDIVAAFEASKKRLLIVGEPGSGKTIAAYSLIEYLDNTEGDRRIPLLVNLSAWEAQENFEVFLVDYLCSSVGYEVHERAVASAFIGSGRYSLILDGLDEIPLSLRQHFSERLDEYVRGLAGEVSVVVTCRTQEYKELLAAHSTGLGLVQAVEILPLSSEQLDSALAALAKCDDKDWEQFLSQRHLTAYTQARDVLSNPLFLNLAVAGNISPRQLLEHNEEQELRNLVLDRYLNRTLADQRQYEAEYTRRYLTWIARFLNGAEVSPFGLKTADYTVFDLADLTPPEPPKRYRLYGALVFGLVLALIVGPIFALVVALALGLIYLVFGLLVGLLYGLIGGLVFGLVVALAEWPSKRSAVSSRLTLVWPSTGRQLLNFLRRAGRGGLTWGPLFGLVFGLVVALVYVPFTGLIMVLWMGLTTGLLFGLPLALVSGLGFGLLETRSVLITSRTPKEARTRSLIAALTWLASGLVGGLASGLLLLLVLKGLGQDLALHEWLVYGLALGLTAGAVFALRNGGWFVVLQKVADRRLARAGNLPPHTYDFLEWGIEQQIFRRVGGGVRFRHNLIQQHLADASEGDS
jgi:hypothetical protein